MSSDAPAPGGGSAAALNGAIGGALITMVCRLSISHKGLEPYGAELLSILEETEKTRSELSGLVDRDTDAFNQVMNAFKMPKATEQEKKARSAAIQIAFRTAAEVPLEVARHCCSLLDSAVSISQKSNPNTASDLGVSAQCAYAGMIGALMNVDINTPSIADAEFVAGINDEARQIRRKADALKSKVDKVIGQALEPDPKN